MQKDGKTLRWHLETVYEQTGKMPEQLDIPELPYEVAHIWDCFLKLSAKRTSGFKERNPLSELEIEAWERRRRMRLDPFEIECIDALDRVYLDCSTKPAPPT